jgi:uncharacterized membrane protein YdjX (TVP38/TMEM64 family)
MPHPTDQPLAEPAHAPATPARRDPRVIGTALLAVAWFTLPLGFSVLMFAYLGEATEWFRAQGQAGVAIAMVAFAVCAGIGLLPTYAQAVLAGWIFGFATGVPVSVVGYVGGALLGWGLSSAVAGDAIRARIDVHPKWRVVRSALVDASAARTAGLVALLRFPPNSPFAFTNLVLAATGVRFWPMMAGSVAGMLPRTAVAVWVGAQGAATGATNLRELMEKQGLTALVVGVVLLVGVLAVMQHIGTRALRAAGLG